MESCSFDDFTCMLRFPFIDQPVCLVSCALDEGAVRGSTSFLPMCAVPSIERRSTTSRRGSRDTQCASSCDDNARTCHSQSRPQEACTLQVST